jgi:hypothetical protein
MPGSQKEYESYVSTYTCKDFITGVGGGGVVKGWGVKGAWLTGLRNSPQVLTWSISCELIIVGRCEMWGGGGGGLYT